MERVIIESPYAGDVRRNTAYARRAMLHSLRLGEAPFASHLNYTQVLDDTHPEEREMGIEAGLAWRRGASYAAFYLDFEWSPGMRRARALYEEEGYPYELRYILTPSQKQELIDEALKPYARAIADVSEPGSLVQGFMDKLEAMASYCVPYSPKDADLAGMLQCPKHDHRHGFTGELCPQCNPMAWADAQERE